MTKFQKFWVPEYFLYQCTLLINIQPKGSTVIFTSKFANKINANVEITNWNVYLKLEKEECLLHVMFGSHENSDAINVGFKRFSEIFGMSGKYRVQEEESPIHINDFSIPNKILPIDHTFFLIFFVDFLFYLAFIITSMIELQPLFPLNKFFSTIKRIKTVSQAFFRALFHNP